MKWKQAYSFIFFLHQSFAVQEFVAETFNSFDFDHRHAPSIKLLLFVLFGFLTTFVFLIVVIFIFRGVMNWMGYNSSQRYELPFQNPATSAVIQPEEMKNTKKESYQNILIQHELIKMQGNDSPFNASGLSKAQRRELAKLLAGHE